MSKQSTSRGASPRSAAGRSPRVPRAASPPRVSAKTTYESIVECQGRIFSMMDNFDRLEDLDREKERLRVEKPDESAYVLRYNEEELVQLSENIGKMTFVEEDFGILGQADSSVEQTLDESTKLIQSMVSHKESEMKKIKELVEKFRQLRRDQELQLGNTLRDIKQSSGVRGLELKLLDREMQTLRLRSECEKKEELLKLVISGLEETEQSIRDMCEQAEISNIQKMTDLVKSTENELATLTLTSEDTSADLKEWQLKLRVLMKDAESAEIDAIRKQKNKLVETLKKVNDDYTAAFASHAQTLKYLVLTEKRANDNAYTLDKISSDREAKKLKALEATVQVLQDSIAIGKIKLEELEAFLGDNNNHVNKRRVTTANGSGKRATVLKKVESASSEETTRNRTSTDVPHEQDSDKQSKRTADQPEEVVKKGDESLSCMQSLLPASGFGAGPNMTLPDEAAKAQKKLSKAPVLKPGHITHISEKSSLEEIRKLSTRILNPGIKSTGVTGYSSPRKSTMVNMSELFNIDSNGNVSIPDKHASLKAVDMIKETLYLMKVPPPPALNAMHRDEDVQMDTKEKRLLTFVTSATTYDQLKELICDATDMSDVDTTGNERILNDCKSKVLKFLEKKNDLSVFTKEKLSECLSDFRDQMTLVAHRMLETEVSVEKVRDKRAAVNTRWLYTFEKLAQEIADAAADVNFSLPHDVKVYAMFATMKDKYRIAEKIKERVLKAQNGTYLYEQLMQMAEEPLTGSVLEYEDDITDDIDNDATGENKDGSDSSSSSCDEIEEVISGRAFSRAQSRGLDAGNTGGSSSKSPSKFHYYPRDRRKQSSILPRGTSNAAGAISVQKAIGWRVLSMETVEEIKEKEAKKKLEEEQERLRVADTRSIKEKQIAEFQEGLMNEIRDSVSEMLSKNIDHSNSKKDKRMSAIGRLSPEKETTGKQKRQTFSGSGVAVDEHMDRQQMFLSMIGRSTARATNAAETLKSRSQQRPSVLRMQLQMGLEKRSKTKRAVDELSEVVSPTERSVHSATDELVGVAPEGSFGWASGVYNHGGTSNPSSTVLDILSLISKSEDSAGGGVESSDLKDVIHNNSEISQLIEKLSVEISENVMRNTPLSPMHIGLGAGKETAPTGPSTAREGVEKDTQNRGDEDGDRKNFRQREKDGLPTGAVQYSGRRSDIFNTPRKSRRTSVCDISIPPAVGAAIDHNEGQNRAELNDAGTIIKKRFSKQDGTPIVPTLQLTIPGFDFDRDSPGKFMFNGSALRSEHGKAKSRNSTASADGLNGGSMSLLGVKAGRQNRIARIDLPTTTEDVLHSGAPDIAASRPITSLDADGDGMTTAGGRGADKDLSVFSENSVSSLSAHIVLPKPQMMVDSRCTTAADAQATCDREVFSAASNMEATGIPLPIIGDSLTISTASSPSKRGPTMNDATNASMTLKSIHTDVSNTSSFFHNWSEGPETDFNPAVLLSQSNEDSSNITVPRPPVFDRSVVTTKNPSSAVSTPLLRRISRSSRPQTVNSETNKPLTPGGALKFQAHRILTSADQKILDESARRAALGTAADPGSKFGSAKSFDEQHCALASILAEIETKGREIQAKSMGWKDLNSTFESNIDELANWKRELAKLKGNKARRTESLKSSEFSELLHSGARRKQPLKDIKIESSLSGYMDMAPHFSWEKTVKMKRNTVKELVNEIASHHANPGRMDVPTVVALLAQESVHAPAVYSSIGPGADHNVKIEKCVDAIDPGDRTDDMKSLSAGPKKTIRMPVKRRNNAWDKSNSDSPLGCEVIRGEDGKQVYLIRKPASIGQK